MNLVAAIGGIRNFLWIVAGLFAWSLIAFGSGYGYKAHRVSVAEAAHEAKQETATTTATAAVAAVDTRAITRLQTALAAAKSRAASLEQALKDQSNATPAPADCALPVGLRDKINIDLATGAR